MNLSRVFIHRPVATVLLAVAVVLAGLLAYSRLPVAPLPQVDYPSIDVSAELPGASPESMAATVATPLERALGSIPGIVEMESSSSQGATEIELRFALDRDVNDAAREVQAAINAARSQLPAGMPSMPQYRKSTPSQTPIMALALSSPRHTPGQLYDMAASLLSQRIAQIPGVAEVNLGGGSLPAVRVALDPNALNHHGIALDEVAAAIRDANTLRPLGEVADAGRRWQIEARQQLARAEEFAPMIVAWRDGRPVRLGEVAQISEGVENRYAAGFHNDRDAVLMVITRQPDANIVETIDAIRARLPALQALLPPDVSMTVTAERSPSIRATLAEARATLAIAIVLVALVVFAFLGDARAALLPTLSIPVALFGALAVIWLCGFSLNTLSLMALIVASVLVVDDAIVVLENIARHREAGLPPMQAALRGAGEVGPTLVSMNLALAAVFASILFIDDFARLLFREFSITLIVAMAVSVLVSLSLTPSLCARLRGGRARPAGPLAAQASAQASAQTFAQVAAPGRGRRAFEALRERYVRSLGLALRHWPWLAALFAALLGLNLWLFSAVPKGTVPSQDTGQLRGFARGDDGLSFEVMQPKIAAYRELLNADPAIAHIGGFIGGDNGINNAFMLVNLKPLRERGASSEQVIARLREQMPKVPGGMLWLRVDQDINLPGDGDDGHELVLLSDSIAQLREWTPRVRDALARLPQLAEVESSGDEGARQVVLDIDRTAAARLGIDMRTIATVLNNSFSQRQIATRYERLNQYRVVLELDPRLTRSPDTLQRVYALAGDGRRVPLSAFASMQYRIAPDRINHTDQFAASTVSFALAPGATLQQAGAAVERALAEVMLPSDVRGRLAGQVGQAGERAQRFVWLVLGAMLVVYLLLGILYESWTQPLTILSTLPSAGLGALAALFVFGGELNLMSLLGLFLLIGVVMKNTILIVDFALAGERERGLSPREAVIEAARLRLRAILMTSVAALFGTAPLLLSGGEGWEMRRPLGLAIVGGLVVSQCLTLYTTPAIYLLMARLRRRAAAPSGCRPAAV